MHLLILRSVFAFSFFGIPIKHAFSTSAINTHKHIHLQLH